ncbi:MAG TPA: DUF3006 domain-containing protein [Pyrinomonadaceae bacterium]|jgi:hypothetical protein|nr:DUF3006 domain-containing protein [Pyrinomonadaceae bacterium]
MTERKENPREKPSSGEEVRAVVDRIEDGDIAVLSLEDEARSQLDVPREQLPQGANSDGDHLLLKFDVDAESGKRTLKSVEAAPHARASAEDRIKKMQERLARMSGAPDKKDFKL